MTQHVNLLPVAPKKPTALRWGVLGLLTVGTLSIVVAAWQTSITASLARDLQAHQQQLDELNRTLSKHTGTDGSDPSAALQSAVSQLSAALRDRQALLARLERGEFGRIDNGDAVLQALSNAISGDVWLTEVSMTGGSSQLSLWGHGLSHDAILSFVDRLNRILVTETRLPPLLRMELETTPQASDTGSPKAAFRFHLH